MGNAENSPQITYSSFLEKYQPISKVIDENYGEGSLLQDKNKNLEVFLKEELTLTTEEYKEKLKLLKSKPFHPNMVSILGNNYINF